MDKGYIGIHRDTIIYIYGTAISFCTYVHVEIDLLHFQPSSFDLALQRAGGSLLSGAGHGTTLS